MRNAFAVGIVASVAALSTASAETFKSPSVGFEVEKPAEWQFATAQQNLDNLKRTELKDQEFQAVMSKYVTAPLVAMTKYAEPYDDVNPSFKVNVRPLGAFKGRDPKDIISAVLPQMTRIFHEAVVTQEAADVTVSGLKGAYARINYTLQAGGASYPTTSELWVVPRGDYFFTFGAGTRQDEKTGSRAEIQKILATVKIEP